MISLNHDLAELRDILAIRLVICRAAASDALGWWDDEALSHAGMSLAERVFPRRPERVAARLAIRAARSRHAAAISSIHDALHLFWLGDAFEMAFDGILGESSPGEIVVPGPVQTIAELASRLAEVGVTPPSALTISGSRLVEVAASPADPLERGRRLAGAYASAEIGTPVFPYLRVGR